MILDRSHWHLRGPVSSLRIEMTNWDCALGSWTARWFYQAAVFDSAGRVLQFDQRGREESVTRRSFTYDHDGRPLRSEFGTVGASIESATTWHYDGRGQFTSVMVSLADGHELLREESTIDFVGRKTKKVIFASGKRADGYGVDGSELLYPAPGAAQQTTRYDAEGRPVEVEFLDAGGAIVQRVMMHRNAQGRLVIEEARGPSEALIQPLKKGMTDDDFRKMQALFEHVHGSIRTTYEYDSEGRLASRATQSGRLGDTHFTYRYDDHGNVVEQLQRDNNRQIGYDAEGNLQEKPEAPRIHETHSSYAYDGYGNWTQCTRNCRFAEDAAFQPAGAEWRTIEYFDQA